MTRYNYIFKQDYDKRVTLRDDHFFCYSPKRIEELYLEKEYELLGEAINNKKKTGKKNSMVGNIYMGTNVMNVYPVAYYNKFLYKTEGYICVGGNRFIVAKSSRVPFLFALLGLLGMTILCIILLFMIESTPVVIEPDHPLPDPDVNVIPVPDDDGPIVSEEGGGAVTMTYTLEASVKLSDRMIGIYLQNPKASNHDVAINMYITSGEEDYLIASSGLIKAGNGLYKLTLSEDAPVLNEGIYHGYYKVLYYNPQTGERALVEADITGLEITVTK